MIQFNRGFGLSIPWGLVRYSQLISPILAAYMELPTANAKKMRIKHRNINIPGLATNEVKNRWFSKIYMYDPSAIKRLHVKTMPIKRQYIFAVSRFKILPIATKHIRIPAAFSEKLLKISNWRQSRLCVIMERIEKLLRWSGSTCPANTGLDGLRFLARFLFINNF